MKCINCNKVISKTANYCSHCGFKVTTDEDNTNAITNNKIDLEELSKIYIGKNSDSFNNNFSICFLLFGFYYLFYRKMWVHGIIWILAVIMCFTTFPIGSIILYPCAKIFGACFFKIEYKNHVKNNINKIINDNPNLTYEELKEKCANEGGVATIIIPLALIFNMLLYILIILIALLFNSLDKYKNNNNNNNNNNFYRYNERYMYY